MRTLTVTAPAKINLSLDVLERLPTGYHRLAMIMQTIGLSDTLHLEMRPEGISLACDDERITGAVAQGDGDESPNYVANGTPDGSISRLPGGAPSGLTGGPPIGSADGFPHIDEIPLDSRNLAWRAAEAFFTRLAETSGLADPDLHGVHIRLTKRIPSAAGLAGGSADAAAVLRGLNALHGFPFSAADLATMGVRLGADVPYCLRGGTCLAEGIGEILTPLPSFAGHWLVLVKPPVSVSTPWVFSRLRLDDLGERPDNAALCGRVAEGDLNGLARGMRNVLERVTEPAHPEIAAIRERMLALGALGSRMSGSGPSVFGLFPNEMTAKRAQDTISREWPACWAVPTVDG